ncbi:hypothetical protein [Streptomyces sp. NPDC006527]|uniref:hypothetical protein n=1 Tax=Streptomyces sp. NPDC006527 TaxID=3364749 RepID=UPI0036822B19
MHLRHVMGVVVALCLTAVVSPSPASAAGTPRAQFWMDEALSGQKLDKDVWSQGYANIPDLTKEGRGCWLWHCDGNWNNVISSLRTDGGGQSPVDLLIFREINYGGTCLYIPKGWTLNRLTLLPAVNNGYRYYISMDNDISSFKISKDTLTPPPGCFTFRP